MDFSQADRFDAELSITPRRDLAMIAVQGPQARAKIWDAVPGTQEQTQALKPFSAARIGEMLIARTGYTGEDGFELMVPAKAVAFMWQALTEAGVRPAGLGARDTLRLEAGMNLYGQDMDETCHAAGVRPGMDRRFLGRARLHRQGRAAGHRAGAATCRLAAAGQGRAARPSARAHASRRRRSDQRYRTRRRWRGPSRWPGFPLRWRRVTSWK